MHNAYTVYYVIKNKLSTPLILFDKQYLKFFEKICRPVL